MPRAGLAEASLALLRAAVADEETVARFRAKIVTVPGFGCSQLWARAVAGRGHGRFWLGAVDGRDVVIIAHRFFMGADSRGERPARDAASRAPLRQPLVP